MLKIQKTKKKIINEPHVEPVKLEDVHTEQPKDLGEKKEEKLSRADVLRRKSRLSTVIPSNEYELKLKEQEEILRQEEKKNSRGKGKK